MKTLYAIDQYAYPTGETHTVGDRDPTPPGWVDQEPPAQDGYRWVGSWQQAPTREQWRNRPQILNPAKEAKKREVDAAYVAALERGVTWNGTRWTATDAGRDTLIELHEVAKEDGVSVTVLDAENGAHTLSATDLDNLRSAGRAYRQGARENRLVLHGQVAAAASHADLDAIDVTAGWPS